MCAVRGLLPAMLPGVKARKTGEEREIPSEAAGTSILDNYVLFFFFHEPQQM